MPLCITWVPLGMRSLCLLPSLGLSWKVGHCLFPGKAVPSCRRSLTTAAAGFRQRKVPPKASGCCLLPLCIALQHPFSPGQLLVICLILLCGHADEGKYRSRDRDALAVDQAPHAGVFAGWDQQCPATAWPRRGGKGLLTSPGPSPGWSEQVQGHPWMV